MGFELSVLITIAIMHFVAVVSPGPDFAVVLKQSLQQGLSASVLTSIGIGSGILLHCLYAILGVSIFITTTPWLMNAMLYLAAAYFIFLGYKGLSSKGLTDQANLASTKSSNISLAKSFLLGFLTNGLNPKATLFFLALFTTVIPVNSSLIANVYYGIYLSLATSLWFVSLSICLTRPSIRQGYQKHAVWFDRIMGIVLVFMALIFIFSDK